jgi:HTH-type transcriptional regulator/antitoxin HigA
MTMIDGEFQTPGKFVQALLGERGWTQDVLATVMEVSASHVSRIVTDRVAIDAEKAIALSEVFEVEPEVFLDLQKKYELAQARMRVPTNPQRALRAKLYSGLPVKEMIDRGWINATSAKDTDQVERELARFFRVETFTEIPVIPHAAKKSDSGSDLTRAQGLWLYRVQSIAKEQIVGRYSPANVRAAIERLSAMRRKAASTKDVPTVLAEAGVRYVAVEALASSKIDGVCFWLNDMAPVVGMTMRYDRIDNFWFVLRHELEHVLRGHGRRDARVDVELEGERSGTGATVSEEERMANMAAEDFCVPKDQMDRFFARKDPYFMERDVIGFAATVGAHPGLVVGQLQHRSGRYDRFRKHLVKVREFITSSAIADGWGRPYVLDTNP